MVSVSKNSQCLISAQQLEAAYAGRAVFSVPKLEVLPGQRLALFGLNGTGKTTLLKVMAGLIWPTKGSVQLLGETWSPGVSGSARSKVAYLGHDTGVFLDLTVEQFVHFANELHGAQSNLSEVGLMLEQFELSEVLGRSISELSFGYKKRTALAATLVRKPRLLLLDEPFHGLDAKQVKTMAEYIQNLDKEMSIVMGTHLASLAESICQSYVVFKNQSLLPGSEWRQVVAYLESGDDS